MGINYYKKLLPTEEVINELHRAVDMLDFEEIDKIKKGLTDGIHICKMSAGWKVVFDANEEKYYEPTRKDLELWLNDKNGSIIGEYGTALTPAEFWKEVDDWNSNTRNYRTSSTERDMYTMRNGPEERFWIDKGYDVQYSEFYSDGLRFATYTDFC